MFSKIDSATDVAFSDVPVLGFGTGFAGCGLGFEGATALLTSSWGKERSRPM